VGSTLNKIRDSYGDKVRIAHLNFPLGFHEHAHLAAQAGVYAHKNGKFWEFHDKLFQNIDSINRETIERVTGEVGLDVADLKKALDGKLYAEIVDAHTKLGTAAGVSGTPAVFINGRVLEGAKPYEEFKTRVDKALAKAEELLAKGAPKKGFYAHLMKLTKAGEIP
jgi:protein-disulfide isomerase